ncbi:MAG: 4,5-DOPA dioxygenase extradiol [Bacteroidetes bacterium]|nr:MAG: 4,5-DOPA dioxygenase extradiol [Bacteroidota bacterium]
MNRRQFVKNVGLASLLPIAMKSELLRNFENSLTDRRMPALFLGHGNPMNAVEENEFVKGFRSIATELPSPTAILVISAHWETSGTFITAMDKPRTIHDFGGFPDILFQQQYPAPGSPELAKRTKNLISSTEVRYDYDWGLDHGAWTVLKHMYPEADIPVIQMSIDYTKDARYHFDLAKQIKQLRDQGVLVIGSGNIVHNLRMVDWRNINTVGSGYDWALEAQEKINELILSRDHLSLTSYTKLGQAVQLAIPSPEHFIPLIYTLALSDENEEISLFNDKVLAGSLTMTSVKIG